jgi:hypothetical protein
MDRVNAVFLTQTFATLVPIASSSARISSSRSLGAPTRLPLFQKSSLSSQLEFPRTHAPWATSSDAASSILSTLSNMDTLLAATSISASASSAASAHSLADQAAALVGGAASLSAILKPNVVIGAAGAIISDIQLVGNCWGDLGAYLVGLATHDQTLINTAGEAMNAVPRQELYQALGDLTLALPGLQAIEALKPISTVLNLIETQYNLDKALEGADSITVDIVNSYSAPSFSTEGIASIIGTVSVQSNNGLATPQRSIQLSSNNINFNTVADPGGDYQLYVPLQVIGFDYATATFTIVDPVGPLGSQVADLSSLNTLAPLQMPYINDQCADPPTFAVGVACICAKQIPDTIGYWIACEP